MLPKKSRIAGKELRLADYRTVKTPYFSLKIKKSSGETPKIGVVAGKSVHKSAVKRNFWKRQAKQALLKGSITGKDIVLVFFPKVNVLTKKQFQDEVLKISRTIK